MRAYSVLLLLTMIALLATAYPALASDPFSVTGNVTDADAFPVPQANVTLLDNNRMPIAHTLTDANGHFAFVDVSGDTPGISVFVTFLAPPNGSTNVTKMSGWHETSAGQIIITDNETRFPDYILPGKGYIHGHIVRASDGTWLTGTVYLSNGKTREVTDPSQEYLFEVGPGNYSVYAVHTEGGNKLTSGTMDVHALPAESKDQVAPVDLRVNATEPGGAGQNLGALAIALVLGLAGILAGYYVLRKK
ncbi:MAG TPA: carboxypeptidase-like regulatory domain-containing protein [Methanocella sp.]|nr:carboxypeptidase-like regulatory domain-containing protein [Methanocella sp.]